MSNKGNRKPERTSAEDTKEELTNFMTPKRPTYPTSRRDTRLPSRPRGHPAIVQTSGRPLQGVTQPQKTKMPKMKTEAQHKSQTSSALILPSEAAVLQKLKYTTRDQSAAKCNSQEEPDHQIGKTKAGRKTEEQNQIASGTIPCLWIERCRSYDFMHVCEDV